MPDKDKTALKRYRKMMVKWFAQYCDNDITNPQGLNKRIREAEQDDWDAILKLVKGWRRCQKGMMLADGTIVTEAEQERRANEFQDHAAIDADSSSEWGEEELRMKGKVGF